METVKAELFGQDPKIQKAVNFARNVAVTKAPILVVGEVGTGKRTLGRYIHQLSSRNGGDLIIVDCSEDQTTVENAILGHRDSENGRFHKGALESANRGTVILANIDVLSEDFQKRIHQILLELIDYDLDVRIISTTTKNLSKLVGSGRFYRGLYNFVSGTQITLPPLRERVSDIEYLAKRFVSHYGQNQSKENIEISDPAVQKMLSHYWTHNLSELGSVIESSLENCESAEINLNDLAIGEKKAVSLISESDEDGLKLMSLKEAEKLLIKKALIHTSENRTQAAKILGVSIRTLRNKINEYRNDGTNYFVNLR